VGQVLWAFSIYLEAVAILPQLFLVAKTGEAENITSHYLFALGSYRALYLANWVYRYMDVRAALGVPVWGVLPSLTFQSRRTVTPTGSRFRPASSRRCCTATFSTSTSPRVRLGLFELFLPEFLFLFFSVPGLLFL
jgi:hypothetical protein